MSASTTASCPILTYHSQLLFGSDYANNSHVALKDDLARVAASGRRIVPLPQLVEALAGRAAMPDLDRVVCISFDDGPDFDWLDMAVLSRLGNAAIVPLDGNCVTISLDADIVVLLPFTGLQRFVGQRDDFGTEVACNTVFDGNVTGGRLNQQSDRRCSQRDTWRPFR